MSKMLQIRLKGATSEGSGGAKPVPVETVTVACPGHLVLADLPVAKGLGTPSSVALVKTIGRRSRRQLGERLHFCVCCDFPIAVYGRLSPCEHAFCLDCARSDSLCYLCDERIQKIQTIKMMEGIFVCAAPHCLKSFLKKTEFESHIHNTHSDLLHTKTEKDGNESEPFNQRQSAPSDSTARAPPRPVFSPSSSNSQYFDQEEKARRQPTREAPPPRPPILQSRPLPISGPAQAHHYPPDSQGFDRSGQQNQQGVLSESPFQEYPPLNSQQSPNLMMRGNSIPVLNTPPFNYPPFRTEGTPPYYGVPHGISRQDSASEAGSEQGSLLGFPPGPTWTVGSTGGSLEVPSGSQGMDDISNAMDSQLRGAFYQGEYGQTAGGDGKGILAPQPLPLPPPPPPPPLMAQIKGGQFYGGDMSHGHDAQGYGWQHDR